MSGQELSSKVIIQEEEPRIRTLPTLATAVLAVVGITERGPVGTATLCTSFEEFIRYFGGDVLNSFLVHGVRGFFQNGGQFLYVVRTVHYTNPDSPATKTSTAGTLTIQTPATAPTPGYILGTTVGPWDLEPGDDLHITVDLLGSVTATFNATAAARENAPAETYVLVNGQTLTVKIDRGTVQTIAFLTAEFVNIGAATAEEVAAVINAKIVGARATVTSGGTKVTITSDKRGLGSYVEVTGGTANAALLFNVAEVQGTGNVLDIDSVTLSEVETIVEAATAATAIVTSDAGRCRITSATTGTDSKILIEAVSTADDELGLDNATHSGSTGAAVDTLKVDGKTDGSYTDDIKTRVSAATSGVASEFNFVVEDGGVAVETFPNVTMLDSDDRFIEKIVNNADTGSRLVAVTDLDADPDVPNYGRPADGLHGPLTGGGDGLAAIADADFSGSATGKTGIRALDLAVSPAPTLLAIPDRATAAVQQAMYQYSQLVRDGSIFCVYDPPASTTAASIVTYFETTAALLGATELGAMYWPRIKVLNPNTAVFGSDENLVVPPSGYIAGMMSRTDKLEGGVYIPPAGIEPGQLWGCVGAETDETLDETKRDIVFPKRINPITKFPGSGGWFVDGARTCKGGGNFPTVAERRGVSHIEQTIKAGLQVYRHKNNNRKLRQAVKRTVDTYLLQQMRLGAFRSMKPVEAFWSDFGDGLNTAAQEWAGRLLGRVGLATNKPAEFIVLSFSQDTRALEEELAVAGAQ
jgi:hypothetical protein